MEKIKLYTKEGEILSTINIMRVEPRAEILIYESKHFIWNKGRYVEASILDMDNKRLIDPLRKH